MPLRGRGIRMPQPVLHLGNIRPIIQCIRPGGLAQRVDTESRHIRENPHQPGIVPDNTLMDRRSKGV